MALYVRQTFKGELLAYKQKEIFDFRFVAWKWIKLPKNHLAIFLVPHRLYNPPSTPSHHPSPCSRPSQASSTSTISPISQSRSVIFAAIAGVVRSVMDAQEIVVHRERCKRMRVVLDFVAVPAPDEPRRD
jgi:hypothetical protein